MRQCEEDRVGSRGCPVLVALFSQEEERGLRVRTTRILGSLALRPKTNNHPVLRPVD